jgi:hypothetical protein
MEFSATDLDHMTTQLENDRLHEQLERDSLKHRIERFEALASNKDLAAMSKELQSKLLACEHQVGELQFMIEVMIQQKREVDEKADKDRVEIACLRQELEAARQHE